MLLVLVGSQSFVQNMLTNEKLVSGLENHESAIASQLPNVAAAAQNPVIIEVDFSKPTGRIRSLQQVHAGPIPRMAGAAQLHEQYKQIGVDYIRTHDVWPFFDIDAVFPKAEADASSEASYNFSSTDLQVQAVKSIGADVFYRLGYSWGRTKYTPNRL